MTRLSCAGGSIEIDCRDGFVILISPESCILLPAEMARVLATTLIIKAEELEEQELKEAKANQED
jgi:hypothetical protein